MHGVKRFLAGFLLLCAARSSFVCGMYDPITQRIRLLMVNANRTVMITLQDTGIAIWDVHGNILHEMPREGATQGQLRQVMRMLVQKIESPEQFRNLLAEQPALFVVKQNPGCIGFFTATIIGGTAFAAIPPITKIVVCTNA